MKKISEYICNILPDSIVYFVLIKGWAYATSGMYGNTMVNEITVTEMITRWEKDHEI